jgi:hypothetical protein
LVVSAKGFAELLANDVLWVQRHGFPALETWTDRVPKDCHDHEH